MAEITSAIIKSLITDDNGTEKYVYPKTVADAIIMDSKGTNLTTALEEIQDAIDNINVSDGSDASTLGGNTPEYYATAKDVSDIVNGVTTVDKATNAVNADTATKAIQDGNGNNITDTYPTKTEVVKNIQDAIDGLSVGDTPIGNASLLDGHDSTYFATAQSIADVTNGITEVAKATQATQDGDGNVISSTYAKSTDMSDADAKVLSDAKAYNDTAYANANAYTDTAIANLINGAPTTLDTLKEIADAMATNSEVVEALDEAVGSKVAQAEYDGHAENTTIHVTAEDRQRWDNNSGGGGDGETLNGLTKEEIGESGARNLIPYPYRSGTLKTENGITWEVDEKGWVYPYGTATANTAYYLYRGSDNLIDGETYTISGCPTDGGTGSWLFRIADDNNPSNVMASDYGSGKTFTYTKDSGELRLYLRITSGVTVAKGDIVFKPMLERGKVSHNYVPYSTGGSDTVDGFHADEIGTSGSKNILPYPHYQTFPVTINGITATDNGDGSLILNGTATDNAVFYLRNRIAANDKSPMILSAGTYVISGTNIDKEKCGTYINVHGNTTDGAWLDLGKCEGGSHTFTIDYDMQVGVDIRVTSGTVCDNLVVEVMLEHGVVAHPWKPYHLGGAKHSLKADSATMSDTAVVANTVNGFSIYTDIAQLGITSYYIPDIVKAMPAKSMFVTDVVSSKTYATGGNSFPSNNGELEIVKPNSGRIRVTFMIGTNANKTAMYFCDLDENNSVINGWLKFSDGGDADTLDSYHASDFIKSGGRVSILGFNTEHDLYVDIDGSIYSIPFGWTRENLQADFGKYLPLDGSAQMSGNLTIASTESKSLYYRLKNALRDCNITVHADGRLGLYDSTNKKWIFVSALDGTTTFSGNLTAPAFYTERVINGKTYSTDINTTGIYTVNSEYAATVGKTIDGVADAVLSFNRHGINLTDAVNNITHNVLHTGNSSPCVVLSSDPGVGASVSYADGTLLFVKKS